MVKAISVWQPWASLIVSGLKDVENRRWRTRHLGPVVIHAAQYVSARVLDEAAELIDRRLVGRPDEHLRALKVLEQFEVLPRAALVGVVDVVDYSLATLSRSPWSQGYGPRDWCWILNGARAFVRPVPWRGQQRLFDVPDDVLARGGLLAEEGA